MNTEKDMLQLLNKKNDVTIYSVEDEEFKTYGRVVTGYEFSDMITYMEENTQIPENGNCYYPSIAEMEQMQVFEELSQKLYGGMPIQIGYCNGRNTTYNGFEYHKGSELNIAVTDFMLVLGHTWDIRENTYRVEDAKVFLVRKGTAIEMYQTTLHLSPCRVNDTGFMDVVVLPRGTNTPLSKRPEAMDDECKLLLQTNKWVLAHPDREPLMKQGAYPGVIGENKELLYK